LEKIVLYKVHKEEERKGRGRKRRKRRIREGKNS
jgi:hypothetical protein